MAITPVIADMNHANSVNFAELATANIWGVIHKARQGVSFGDPAYQSRQILAKQAGFLWAAYDFATGDDVATNVANFLTYAKLGPQDGAWLDFEDNAASQMSGDEAYEFLDRVSQQLGRACGIYGGNRIREQIDAQAAKWIDMAKVAPLWQCRYIKGQPADVAALWALVPPIPPWKANTIIQYTGDGAGPAPHTVPGLENGADLNVFNGNRDQLAAIWPGPAPAGAATA